MKLKVGSQIKYGIPYQGSKSKIIPDIARFFPNAENFYDLFGGGFSVSHYMLAHRSKSYKYFHYNELRSGLCELIKDAINGKYNYEIFKPEWISRERFMSEKESNAYIKLIWSFGNNGESYLFGKNIEQEKRSMHQAVVFNEFDLWFTKTFKIYKWPEQLNITGKRLYLNSIGRKLMRLPNVINERQRLEQLEQLQRLEQLQQLQRLEQLQQLQQLQLTNFNYRNVEINPNSVVYCDIPYQSTSGYGPKFNHEDFFNWASAQTNPLFISEYNIKDPRFYLLKEFRHRSTIAQSKNDAVIEKLYGNKIAFDIIQNAIRSKNKIT